MRLVARFARLVTPAVYSAGMVVRDAQYEPVGEGVETEAEITPDGAIHVAYLRMTSDGTHADAIVFYDGARAVATVPIRGGWATADESVTVGG